VWREVGTRSTSLRRALENYITTTQGTYSYKIVISSVNELTVSMCCKKPQLVCGRKHKEHRSDSNRSAVVLQYTHWLFFSEARRCFSLIAFYIMFGIRY
jgi:hypothetical protein